MSGVNSDVPDVALPDAPPAEDPPARRAEGLLQGNQALVGALIGAFIIGHVLMIVAGGKDSDLVLQAAVTGLLLGGVYALISMGLTLVFGVLGIVNFAHGAMLTLGMYCAYALVDAGVNLYLALLVVVPLAFALGYAIQAGLLNRLMAEGETNGQLLVTLGISLIITNGLLLGFGGLPKTIVPPVKGNLEILGAIAPYSRVIAFVGAGALGLCLLQLLRVTKLGMGVRSVAASSQGAYLVGINVPRIRAITFGLGVACVGAAGALILPFMTLTPTTGEAFTILAFIIVVLGGLGSVVGAIIGGLSVGVIQTSSSLYLDGTKPMLLVSAIFILVLLMRPEGIFGVKTR